MTHTPDDDERDALDASADRSECERIQRMFSPMMDGALTHEEVDVVGMHLAGCAACRQFQSDLLEIHSELLRVPEATETEIALCRDRILRTVYGTPSPEAATGGWLRGWLDRWWTLGAGWETASLAFAAVLLAIWIGSMGPGPAGQERRFEVARDTAPPAARIEPDREVSRDGPDVPAQREARDEVAPEGVEPPSRRSPLVLASLATPGQDDAVFEEVRVAGDELAMQLRTEGGMPVLWVMSSGRGNGN